MRSVYFACVANVNGVESPRLLIVVGLNAEFAQPPWFLCHREFIELFYIYNEARSFIWISC